MTRTNGGVAADVVKGALAGAIGVWLMDLAGEFLYKREDSAVLHQEKMARVDGKDPAHVAAGRLAGAVGANLSPEEPHPAGIAVHYALGVLPGALYGPLRRRVPGLSMGNGLAYGLGLFLLFDEVLNPLLNLASGPAAYPWQAHARGAVAHAVLGIVTDCSLEVLDRTV